MASFGGDLLSVPSLPSEWGGNHLARLPRAAIKVGVTFGASSESWVCRVSDAGVRIGNKNARSRCFKHPSTSPFMNRSYRDLWYVRASGVSRQADSVRSPWVPHLIRWPQ